MPPEKIVCIERNQEKIDLLKGQKITMGSFGCISENTFALNPDEYGSSSSFAKYYLNNRFMFEFVRTGTMYTGTPQEKEVIMDNPYDTIFEIIKRKCKYVAVISQSPICLS